jgi:hypothetical protein
MTGGPSARESSKSLSDSSGDDAFSVPSFFSRIRLTRAAALRYACRTVGRTSQLLLATKSDASNSFALTVLHARRDVHFGDCERKAEPCDVSESRESRAISTSLDKNQTTKPGVWALDVECRTAKGITNQGKGRQKKADGWAMSTGTCSRPASWAALWPSSSSSRHACAKVVSQASSESQPGPARRAGQRRESLGGTPCKKSCSGN